MLTSKTLRLMTDALYKSLKIDKKVAQFHIANAFYNTSWNKLFNEVSNNTSPFQKLDEQEIQSLINHMAHTFSEHFKLPITTALELTQCIEPFTQSKPKAFRIDLNENKKPKSDDSIDLSLMREMAGSDNALLEHLREMLKGDPEVEDALSNISSLNELQDKMRISFPVHVGAYYDFLNAILEWDLNDDNYNEEYTHMEPSFHINTEHDGIVPVFLLSYITTPGDEGDKLHENVKNSISNQYNNALLIFKDSTFKEINDNLYGVIGAYYANKQWSHTTLCKIPPDQQHRKIGNNFDLESPTLSADFTIPTKQGIPLHIPYFSFLRNGADKNGKIGIPKSLPSIKGVGGWSSFVG